MKFAMWNVTKGSWVKDADSNTYGVWTTTDAFAASRELAKVNDLKKLNPANKDDEIILKIYGQEKI